MLEPSTTVQFYRSFVSRTRKIIYLRDVNLDNNVVFVDGAGATVMVTPQNPSTLAITFPMIVLQWEEDIFDRERKKKKTSPRPAKSLMKEKKHTPRKSNNGYPDEEDNLSSLLKKVKNGDKQAENDLFRELVPQLKAIARNLLRHERNSHTMSSTDVMQEFYLKLTKVSDLTLNDRSHFLKIASKYMRQFLIDYSRRHKSKKNNRGIKPQNIDDEAISVKAVECDIDQMLDIHKALQELEQIHPGWAEIVEMRYFGGLPIKDIAEAKGVAPRTIDRHWQHARRWLYARLDGPKEDGQKENE